MLFHSPPSSFYIIVDNRGPHEQAARGSHQGARHNRKQRALGQTHLFLLLPPLRLRQFEPGDAMGPLSGGA